MRNIIRKCRSGRRTRPLVLLLILAALTMVNVDPWKVAAGNTQTASAHVLQTLDVATLDGTLDLLTNAAGDQFDAHLDCGVASYTSDDLQGGPSQIKYRDLNTNLDRIIPANGVASQSDVAGGRITFTETTATGSYVVVFDPATQTRTTVSDVTSGAENNSAIGANLVAFEDRSYSNNVNLSEIALYELDANFYTRLTSDSLFDKNPAVSPNGDVVVWEKCQVTGLGCDIYSALKVGSGLYSTQRLTGDGEDRGPDTNGQIVAYISDKSGENDIYFQPVGGGTETHVSIPGDQRNLAISGDLIAFESQVELDGVPEYDIFVYDVRTANVYQVSNTAVDDVLNDIATCNGTGRIVYSAPQSGYDVFSFTFQIPTSPADEINDLIQLLQSYHLPKGIESRLMAKLQDALAALSVGDTATACDSLTSFINTCQALPGKKLTDAQLTELTNTANKIKTDMGCQ